MTSTSYEVIQQAAQILERKIQRWKQIEAIVRAHPEWLKQDEQLAKLVQDEAKSAA